MEKNEESHLHAGHRQRMIERFLKEGMHGFAEHEVLELYLYTILPRTDTNHLAHRLIERFGSFAAVCDAPMASLMQVNGVGERTAAYIKMLPGIVRTYCVSQVHNMKVVNSTEDAGKLLMPYFIGSTREEFYIVLLDNAGKVLGVTRIGVGNLDRATVDLRNIIETVFMYNATKVVLAHNHPRSTALPSPEDIVCTRKIIDALSIIGVTVVDHLVFSYALDESRERGEYISIMENVNI